MNTVVPMQQPAKALAMEAEAAVLEAPGRFFTHNVPVEAPGAGDVLVRLEGCGVCASSLPTWEGRPWFSYPLEPGQLGHEGWGRVCAVGSGVAADWVGRRVALAADGAFASHLCAPVDALVELPAALDAQPLPLEPLGCAVRVVERAAFVPGLRVAVVGCGFLGLLVARLAGLVGAEVTALSRRSTALDLARDWALAEPHALDDPHALAETLRGSFDVVVEAVGLQSGLDAASALIREGGRLVIAGYHQDGLRSVNLQDWNWKALDLVNAHERDPGVLKRAMATAVERLAAGDFKLEPLLTHRYTLDQLDTAFSDLRDRPDGFLKGWVALDGGGLEPTL